MRNENITIKTLKDGTKLYPIGSVYKYQHVFDNYYCRTHIPNVQENFTKEEAEIFDAVENHLYEFSCQGTYLGMYYSDFKHRKLIMKVIDGYIDRHGGQL